MLACGKSCWTTPTHLNLPPEFGYPVDLLEPLGVGVEEDDGLEAGELRVVQLDPRERRHDLRHHADPDLAHVRVLQFRKVGSWFMVTHYLSFLGKGAANDVQKTVKTVK